MNLRWKTAQFFEVWWWRFYLKGKSREEYLRNKKQYWHQQLDACADVFRITDKDTIIDMGCGPSGLYTVFPNGQVTAVDPLLDQYEKTLPLFKKSDYPGVVFVTSPIETYNTTQTYDYVFCMNAINHVKDIKAGYAKLASLCNKNGKIIVTIDAHNNNLMKAIFRIGPGDILHPHQYNMEEYTNFLDHEGFKVIKTVCLDKGMVFNHYLLVAERK